MGIWSQSTSILIFALQEALPALKNAVTNWTLPYVTQASNSLLITYRNGGIVTIFWPESEFWEREVVVDGTNCFEGDEMNISSSYNSNNCADCETTSLLHRESNHSQGQWLVGVKRGGYVAICCSHPFIRQRKNEGEDKEEENQGPIILDSKMDEQEFDEDCCQTSIGYNKISNSELVCTSPKQSWLVVVGGEEEFSSLEEFVSSLSQYQLHFNQSIPNWIHFWFGIDGGSSTVVTKQNSNDSSPNVSLQDSQTPPLDIEDMSLLHPSSSVRQFESAQRKNQILSCRLNGRVAVLQVFIWILVVVLIILYLVFIFVVVLIIYFF